MPTVRTRDVDLHYEVSGTGSPIVWVPGTGLRGTTWDRQTTQFSTSHRCITVDLRGSGRTTGGGLAFSVADLADDLAGAMDELGIGPASFVGLSLGSAVVQELALARPELVSAAVLLSTWSSTSQEHHIRRHFESRLYAIENGPLDVFAQFAFWMSAPSVIDDEPDLQLRVEAELAESMSLNPAGTAAHFRADLDHETLSRLGGIRCPVLVLHGDEDLITLPTYNARVAQAIPGAQLATIERAGHLAWLERPEAVNEHIATFLAATSRLSDEPSTARTDLTIPTHGVVL